MYDYDWLYFEVLRYIINLWYIKWYGGIFKLG